jgi:hypothetical protein
VLAAAANYADWDLLYVAVGSILFVLLVVGAAILIPQKDDSVEPPLGSPDIAHHERRQV